MKNLQDTMIMKFELIHTIIKPSKERIVKEMPVQLYASYWSHETSHLYQKLASIATRDRRKHKNSLLNDTILIVVKVICEKVLNLPWYSRQAQFLYGQTSTHKTWSHHLRLSVTNKTC